MKLTPRETSIARLWLEGHQHAEIARQLGISLSSVGVHLYRVRQRLGLAGKNDVALGDALRKIIKQPSTK
jgi:DNA-binding CsgD family transcriptional regulator